MAENVRPEINIPETPPADPDFNSLLTDVLADSIPPDELGVRLKAKDGFARLDDRIAIRGDSGIFGSNETTYQSRRILESRVVTDDQREVIRGVAERARGRSSLLNAGQALSIAQSIMNGELGNGALLEKARDLGLDDLTAASLQVFAEAKGDCTDDNMGDIVREYLSSGDDKDLLDYLETVRGLYADVSDTAIGRSQIKPLEQLAQSARQLSVRSRFIQLASNGVKTGSDIELREAFRELDKFQTVFDGDKVAKDGLVIAGLTLSRDYLLGDALQAAAVEGGSFAVAAERLVTIAAISTQIGDAEDFENTLNILAGDIYRSELGVVFSDLLQGVEISRPALQDLRERLKTIAVRRKIGDVDFLALLQEESRKFEEVIEGVERLAEDREVVELRQRFVDDPDVATLVEGIIDIPAGDKIDDELRQQLLDDLAVSIAATKGINPRRFEDLRAIAVGGIRRSRSQGDQENIDLLDTPEKRNVSALSYMVDRFKNSIMPLFEVVRGGGDGARLTPYITGKRNDYIQNIERLERQRALSDSERAYLESVELLSSFNPHLVALIREKPELTSLYMEQYFAEIDGNTKEQIGQNEETYVPLVQLGLGPSGLAAAGELARSNPELSAQTLFIDAGRVPGGPFAIPKGLSWSLNSANAVGATTNILPDQTDIEAAGGAVRSYGSPLVAYPGERLRGKETRGASINATVDYLPNPDNVSTTQYPSNVDLARVLQLQAALLVDNAMFSTRIISVDSVSDGKPGNKRLTLEHINSKGETVRSIVRTDALIVSSGLGEPNFGIRLEGSNAEALLESEANTATETGFPILSDTLGAFEYLSSPEAETPVAPKGTVVIYGGGNSADVLVEYLGRQFESGNPALDSIDKVVIVTSKTLSERPRYARINDLKPRNGKKNFLEIVDARVEDVGLNDNGRAVLLDGNGEPIQIDGSILEADHVIAASGFQPELDKIFAGLLAEGESLDRRRGTNGVVLPTNPGFTIADTLTNDPTVLIVGTASRADFTNQNKLGQLPAQSAEALLNNGPENAVAIGFRAPDTRAAVRLKFTNFKSQNEGQLRAKNTEPQVINVGEIAEPEEKYRIPLINTPLPTRRNVDSGSDTLTALLLDNINRLRLPDNANAQFDLVVALDENGLYLSGSQQTPKGLLTAVQNAASDPYFQSYLSRAVAGRRRFNKLDISLSFSNGKLRLRDGSRDGKRTFAEVS